MRDRAGEDDATRMGRAQIAGERTLGRFVLRRELGSGAFGRVYRAYDPALRREVALKVFRDPGGSDARERFEREATIAAGLRHPHVVRIFERGVSGDQRWIAMELVEGSALDERLPTLERREAIRVLAQVASAVGAAHEAGIVHRDLKPGNVLLTAGGDAKVLDFGLARTDEAGPTLTRSGTVMGTPAYMSPEQISAQLSKVGPASDVWAIGVMLYESLCGRRPYPGDCFAEIRESVLGRVPPAPRMIDPDVPPGLEAICLRCLAHRIEDRFATGAEVAVELERWLADKTISLPRLPPARPSGRGRLAIGLLAGAVAIAIGAALTTRPEEETPGRTPPPTAGDDDAARRALELWGRVATKLTDGEINLRTGNVQQARARLDEGIALCREFLAEDDLPHARYFLARFLAERGARDEALAELDRALEADPGLGEARLLRGRLRVDVYEDRSEATMRSLRASGRTGLAWSRLAEFDPDLLRLRQEAADDLAAPSGRSSFFQEIDAIEGRADLARIEGRLGEARDMLQDVLGRDPIRIRSRLALALVHHREGAFDAALEEAAAAIRFCAGSARAHLVRCQFRQALAERERDPSRSVEAWRSSIEDADRAIELGEATATARCLRADAHRRLARLTKGGPVELEAAIDDYTRALELDPRSVWALGNRGYARADLAFERSTSGRDARAELLAAIDDFGLALQAAPNLPEAWNGRGVARQYLADAEAARGGGGRALVEAALADHDEASRRDPTCAAAEANAARALIRLAALDRTDAADPEPRLARALERARRAVALDAALPDAYVIGADVLTEMGRIAAARGADPTPRLQEAIRLATRAIDLAPGSLPPLIARSRAWHEQGNSQEVHQEDARKAYRTSLEDLDRVLEHRPHDAVLTAQRAGTRMGLARSEQAAGADPEPWLRGVVEDCERAIDLEPGNATLYYMRGHAKFALDDGPGARSDWERAIALDPTMAEALRPLLRQVGG